ncbi:MAG TPA: response regulator transcription factor, partial [Pyrinomonadaceae bacterium]|nr:response regulator transcription factor [Pyrinomonadaceae bacterium]
MSAPSIINTKTATLLIVDSDAGSRLELFRLFEEAGHRAFTASDAPAALRLLHREICDLVILDIDIPGVNGLALCRLLRAQASTKQLPLVVFTNSDDENRKVEAFAAGADDYIVKPSSPRELLTRISAHLETAQREWALVGTNRELQFLADLGRGLLRALEPAQVVRHVAGATYEGTGAVLCASALSLDERGPIICAFDREGSAEDERVVRMDRLTAWLASSAASTSSALIDDPTKHILRDE